VDPRVRGDDDSKTQTQQPPVTYDLLLRGGRVVTDSGVEPLAVGVADGRIVAIAPEIDGSAREEVDAAGLIIMPGAIDAHVHFNDPGRTDWEGIATGSAALAAGGGTCFFDMPLNASPPTLDGPSFDLKRAAAEGQAATDFGLWGGLVPGPLDRLDELAARGVVGFKAFMSGSGIADFEAVDDLTLFDGMTRAAALGLPVAVHAESDTLTAGLAARARAEGRTGVRDYLACRPLSPNWTPSAAPCSSPRRPGARSTSSTSAPGAASPSSRRPAHAAWT